MGRPIARKGDRVDHHLYPSGKRNTAHRRPGCRPHAPSLQRRV